MMIATTHAHPKHRTHKTASVWMGLLLFILLGLQAQAQVKIGDNPTDIHPFAVLEIESHDKGILIPRMTTQQRDAVFTASTPEGMIIFNTTKSKLQIYHQQIDQLTGKKISNELTWDDIGDQPIVPAATTAPTVPVTGELYLDTQTNIVQVYNGTVWIPLNAASSSNGGTGGAGWQYGWRQRYG